MKETGDSCDIRAVIKFAGAFIAWIIGSGFATGQEILQFFTSYGYYSYGVVLLNLLGFLFLGQVLLTTGYDHRDERDFNHFIFFCGKKAGRFYSWLIPVTLLMIMAVLISGAGATLSEYYGINRYLGSVIMAVMVLCAGRCLLHCSGPGHVFFLLHYDVDGLQPYPIPYPSQKQDDSSCGGSGCVSAGDASLQPFNQCILSLCWLYGIDLYRMRGL